MFIVVAGEGGHFTQAKRLLSGREIESEFILITDNEKLKMKDAKLVKSINPLRGKYNINFFSSFFSFVFSLREVNNIFRKNDISKVISTGPGISLIVSIIAKIYSVEVVHIETWSRFKSKSFTGKFMYYLADSFIIQHKCLLSLYPKAKYGGLL